MSKAKRKYKRIKKYFNSLAKKHNELLECYTRLERDAKWLRLAHNQLANAFANECGFEVVEKDARTVYLRFDEAKPVRVGTPPE